MANRTEDSAMTNLRALMDLENQRVDQENRARAEAERDRRSRAAEERSRAEEASRKRALEAEAARAESAEIRRLADERVESERMARELKVRLEIDQRTRAEAQATKLAHLERMALLEASAAKGKGVSGGVAVALVGLVLAVVGVAGFVLHAQAQTRAEIAAMQRPVSAAPVASDNSDLRRQLAEAEAHTRAARDALALHQTVTPPAPPVITPRQHGTATTRTRPVEPGTGAYDHLLEGGTDPITDTGLEGGGARRRHR